MSIVFYYAPMTEATRVHWALEELGIPYRKVKIDLRGGENRTPEFLALNPSGKVPVLVDRGASMVESLAMMLHLGESYGVERGLWPAPGTPERMQALSWLVWGSITYGANTRRYVVNSPGNAYEHFPEEHRNPFQAAAAARDVEANLAALDERLSDRPYLLGDGFSLVDVENVGRTAFARMSTGVRLSSYAHVSAWMDRCTSRPGRLVAVAG